jgi:hypothetical protein
MGAALLLLSAFWQPLRQSLVSRLPLRIQQYVPGIYATI